MNSRAYPAAVLVTGANGFIGREVCSTLKQMNFNVKAVVRRFSGLDPMTSTVVIDDINALTDWQVALAGIDVIVHLAARVHVMQETSDDALSAYRSVNTAGTENLAQQAAAAGVKRFIFLSSIKVFGEQTDDTVLTAESPPIPMDPYALSKWEAEQRLHEISATTGMEIVIIRPPLVYGEGVKGNFLRLMRLIQRQLPLPLASITNQRSLVFVKNLSNLISHCILHPQAAGRLLVIADNDVLSTPALILLLAQNLGVRPRLWRMPVGMLKLAGQVLNKQSEVDRLCGSLNIDASKTYQLLNWQPPYSITQGVAFTVAAFLVEQNTPNA